MLEIRAAGTTADPAGQRVRGKLAVRPEVGRQLDEVAASGGRAASRPRCATGTHRIGVDPHKGSHTAVAIGAAEEPLGQLRVRACVAQAEHLLAWAAPWPERARAIESTGGLGHRLAQQLVAAGERVLDVQTKLAARVRLLAAGAVNKNDPLWSAAQPSDDGFQCALTGRYGAG